MKKIFTIVLPLLLLVACQVMSVEIDPFEEFNVEIKFQGHNNEGKADVILMEEHTKYQKILDTIDFIVDKDGLLSNEDEVKVSVVYDENVLKKEKVRFNKYEKNIKVVGLETESTDIYGNWKPIAEMNDYEKQSEGQLDPPIMVQADYIGNLIIQKEVKEQSIDNSIDDADLFMEDISSLKVKENFDDKSVIYTSNESHQSSSYAYTIEPVQEGKELKKVYILDVNEGENLNLKVSNQLGPAVHQFSSILPPFPDQKVHQFMFDHEKGRQEMQNYLKLFNEYEENESFKNILAPLDENLETATGIGNLKLEIENLVYIYDTSTVFLVGTDAGSNFLYLYTEKPIGSSATESSMMIYQRIK